MPGSTQHAQRHYILQLNVISPQCNIQVTLYRHVVVMARGRTRLAARRALLKCLSVYLHCVCAAPLWLHTSAERGARVGAVPAAETLFLCSVFLFLALLWSLCVTKQKPVCSIAVVLMPGPVPGHCVSVTPCSQFSAQLSHTQRFRSPSAVTCKKPVGRFPFLSLLYLNNEPGHVGGGV